MPVYSYMLVNLLIIIITALSTHAKCLKIGKTILPLFFFCLTVEKKKYFYNKN